VLLIVCEEGMEEYDPTAFSVPNVQMEVIEDEDELSEALLMSLVKKHNAAIVMVEYNGMWQVGKFYENLPEDWFVYQELFIADSRSIELYNKNMRSLVVDKLNSCDAVAFNRADDSTDRESLHKLVRGVSRNASIVYELTDGTLEYDTIEDPLPFDINADIVKIEDDAYAWWYRDLCAEMEKYDGKKVRFKGMIVKDEDMPKGVFIAGRHVMTCCADDIRYSGIACKWKSGDSLKTYDWVEITGKIAIEEIRVYETAGPVIHITSVIPTAAPDVPVATFN